MSRTPNRITLVCYDITSNKLRRKIDKCLKDFGIRLQYSVYLCRLDAGGVVQCRDSLLMVLERYQKEKRSGDSLIILERLNPNAASCLLGSGIIDDELVFRVF